MLGLSAGLAECQIHGLADSIVHEGIFTHSLFDKLLLDSFGKRMLQRGGLKAAHRGTQYLD
ncbi:hypothetical protein D3C87_2072990 [compost metagenome]